MTHLYSLIRRKLGSSVLARAAIVMGTLATLSLVSILLSTLIAEDISGRANAVNVSGSLRFLSYRILSEVQQPEKRAQALGTIRTFEERLRGIDHFIKTKSDKGSASVQEGSGLLQRWENGMRDLVIRGANGDVEAIHQMAHDIPDFVDQIDRVVYLIEVELESKAHWLRVVQLGLLGLVVLLSAGAILLLRKQLVIPLGHLLEAAKTVTQGSFSARVTHVSDDELGRLGQAFNVMVAEIATMYGHLEDKVKEKTLELQRTNEALELLYRVSQKLSATDLNLERVNNVLQEVEDALNLDQHMICISENHAFPAHAINSNLSEEERHRMCHQRDCAQCFKQASQALPEQAATTPFVVVPLGDGDQLRGVLPVMLKPAQSLTVDQLRIIETVGHHVSNALLNIRRTEERHRIAVMEERSVIARELHDSIAQSLSYLKIQVTRLEKQTLQPELSHLISDELKPGLNSAYRELRELISTFRLRIDERGLNVALQETIHEFSKKLGFDIALDNHLSGIVLSANEELHVMRIIREALSNIEKHAAASQASVTISTDALQSVTVRIRDNGKGFDPQIERPNHFGVNIMHDRTDILAGRLQIESAPGAGTQVTLQFLPQQVRQAHIEPQ